MVTETLAVEAYVNCSSGLKTSGGKVRGKGLITGGENVRGQRKRLLSTHLLKRGGNRKGETIRCSDFSLVDEARGKSPSLETVERVFEDGLPIEPQGVLKHRTQDRSLARKQNSDMEGEEEKEFKAGSLSPTKR